jgi:hypothetical protein
MKRDLVYAIPGETLDAHYTLEEYIERAKRRGVEEFQIQTYDGFIVYESLYKHNPDGTKKLITKYNLIKKQFTPNSLDLLDDETKIIYDSIENNNLKIIFLYIMAIVNNKHLRGDDLIKILCGENVEYQKQIYSKGP